MEPRADMNLGIEGARSVGFIPRARDPVSQQPQFKSSPVNIHKVTPNIPEPWLLARYAELSGDSIEPFAARSVGGIVMSEPASRTGQL